MLFVGMKCAENERQEDHEDLASTETREPSFRELTASTEKRRGGPFLRTPSRSSSRWHTQHAALGSFPATRLAARENDAVFCGRVIHHAGDISIVENCGDISIVVRHTADLSV